MRTFAHSVVLIATFSVATRAIGFVFRIFLSRVLGAEMLGVYQIALSFFMIFLTVIASGLPLAISKEVAKSEGKKEPLATARIAYAGLIISLVASTVLCIAVFALRHFAGFIFTDERCIVILLILVPSVIACSVYTALRAVWWGEKRFFLLGATELFEQIMRVLFFVILLALPFSIIDVAGIAGLSYTLACFASALLVAIVYIKTNGKNAKKQRELLNNTTTSTNYIRPLFKSATPITGVRLLGSIAMPIIALVIPVRLVSAGFTKSQAIAQFGIAMGMTMPLLTIPGTVISALAVALVPELSSAHAKKDTESVSRQINQALEFTLLITFLLIPVFMSCGEGIGQFLYSNTLAGVYLANSAWIMIPLSLSLITNAILNSLGAETKAMQHYIFGSIALFASIWFLPQFLGVGSLITGIGLCMSIVSVLNIRLITHLNTSKPQVFEKIIKLGLVCIPVILLGTQVFKITARFQPLFIALALCGTICVSTLALLCNNFGIADFKKLKTTLARKKSTKK